MEAIASKHHNVDYLTLLSKGLMDRTMNDIAGSYLAEIISIDKDNATCDLQPIEKIDGKEDSIVHSAHFLVQPIHYVFSPIDTVYDDTTKESTTNTQKMKQIKPQINYNEHDVVVVMILKLDDDNFDGKTAKPFNTSTSRIHDVSASYVVAKVATSDDFLKEGDS